MKKPAARAKGSSSRTVNVLIDRFVREVVPKLAPTTRRDKKYHMVTLRRHFGTRIAAQLKPSDFNSFMNVSVGKVHRNKLLNTLSAVFSRAVREWHWLDHNVCTAVPRHKSTPPQHREVTDDAIAALKAVAPANIRLTVELALLTGQLQSAVVGLRWSQVAPNSIRFRSSKTGDSLQVPVTAEIQAVLDTCRARSGRSAFVIPTRTGERYTNEGFRAGWQRIMEKLESAGHNRFTFHDIRTRAEEIAKSSATRSARADSALSQYTQFESSLRKEASGMSQFYEIFYCLERSTRQLVSRVMVAQIGDDWWTPERVTPDVAAKAAQVMREEREGGITPRSTQPIDYSYFGQLSVIINKNWALFESRLPRGNQKSISRVMHTLNLLRGPIAHSYPLSEDEIDRFHGAVRDWLRFTA
jgi:integrase